MYTNRQPITQKYFYARIPRVGTHNVVESRNPPLVAEGPYGILYMDIVGRHNTSIYLCIIIIIICA